MTLRRVLLVAGLVLVLGGAVALGIVLGQRSSSTGATTTSARATTTTTVLQDLVPGAQQLGQGDVAGARKAIEDYMKVNPEDLRAWYLLALTYERQNDLPGAVKVYEDLLKDDPQNFEAHFRIAQLYRVQKRLGEAATEYQKALDLNNDFTAARVALAEVDVELGEIDKAINLYFDVIEMRPMGTHLDEIRLALAKLLLKVGQPENAIIQLNKALAENPDNAEAKALLAKLQPAGATATTAPAGGGTTGPEAAPGANTTTTKGA
ncbi:MAG: tetratricopeptide repeat protein [Actinobacteria bacterium]|nr:tetratricopeptide repeat protein [Actinomycetota bacterium]